MVQLPKNTKNTQERISEGVEQILDYIAKQIIKHHENGSTSDHVASVSTGSDTWVPEYVKFFPNDLLKIAMEEVKRQGYFVWCYIDYRGSYDYWITQTDNNPHSWFRKF